MASPVADGKKSVFSFPWTFYLINGVELFERGAYYAFNAQFTVFMLFAFQQDGMTAAAAASLAGTLAAVLFLLLYTIPVVSAPFAEKYGYRVSLAVVFVLLAAGYLVTYFATGTTMILLAVALIGLGAGVFKPIPAAIVSQTSTETQRNLAFQIYYACINIGALVFPGALGLFALWQGWTQGSTELMRLTFLTSAVLVGVNFLICVFVFRNLREPQKDKSILDAVATLGEIRRYPSFLVLMAIYTGFWFMYVLSLTFLAPYMATFGRMPAWFNESLLQTINPLVIIVGAPLLAGLSSRVKALPLMITGILLYSVGLLTLGFSSISLLFVAGVVLFSVGELLTHPSYLSYVSRIAPPDKVSIFLGYGFIPIGVGQFFGAKIGGDLYGRIALEGGQPGLYWAIMASVGFVTAALLLVYNFVLARRQAPAAPVAAQPRRRFPVAPVAALAILLLIPAVVFAGTAVPSPEGEEGEPIGTASLATQSLADIASKEPLKAGAEATQAVTLPETATGTATFTLAWQDEAAGQASTNEPDTFEIRVLAPNGTEMGKAEATNGADGKGQIPVQVAGAVGGDWQVVVKLVKVGPQKSSTAAGPLPVDVPAGPLAPAEDTGNAWTLKVAYQAPA